MTSSQSAIVDNGVACWQVVVGRSAEAVQLDAVVSVHHSGAAIVGGNACDALMGVGWAHIRHNVATGLVEELLVGWSLSG